MKWGPDGDEDFEDSFFSHDDIDPWQEYENPDRCPECGGDDIENFGEDVDKCRDCGAFLESEDFDDDQEGTDRINKRGYRDEWEY